MAVCDVRERSVAVCDVRERSVAVCDVRERSVAVGVGLHPSLCVPLCVCAAVICLSCSHFSYNVNYSTFGFMDRLHGTDLDYQRSIARKRHVTLTGIASANELYPDVVGEGEGEGEEH